MVEMSIFFIDEDSTKKSKSRSVSDYDETSRSTARRRVGGARDRRNFGDLGEATVGCQDGLVCTPVEFGRSECRPENTDSKHTTNSTVVHNRVFL